MTHINVGAYCPLILKEVRFQCLDTDSFHKRNHMRSRKDRWHVTEYSEFRGDFGDRQAATDDQVGRVSQTGSERMSVHEPSVAALLPR